MTEPIRPSVCRNARRNTARKVSAVRIARAEYQGWPPRLVRGSAAQAATASSVNQMGWTAPDGITVPRCGLSRPAEGAARVSITMIGLDIAKSVFQLHGVDAGGTVQLKRKLQRGELIAFFERQPRCTLVMEACGAAHHWARVLSGLGHEVKLIAPEAVRPFVKRGKKNDVADAAAICAAASRPDATFVAIKSLEQQGVLTLHSVRSLLVKQDRKSTRLNSSHANISY